MSANSEGSGCDSEFSVIAILWSQRIWIQQTGIKNTMLISKLVVRLLCQIYCQAMPLTVSIKFDANPIRRAYAAP
jgi:hypothetical protein